MKQESWTSNVIQRRQRLDNFCTCRSKCHLQPIFVCFLRGEIICYAKQTNKQTNKNNNSNSNILDTFVKKKGFFMEKLSARGYKDTELFKADSPINFEDRQHFIKEKLKSTAIPLVFNTKYNRNFAGKYIRQALLKHWNITDKNVRLKMIFPSHPW